MAAPLLGEGEVVTTPSGRATTPFPRVDLGSERKTINTLARVDAWLFHNAALEATARGLTLFHVPDPLRPTPADRDAAALILFDHTFNTLPLEAAP